MPCTARDAVACGFRAPARPSERERIARMEMTVIDSPKAAELGPLADAACAASQFLKALSNENRLLLLCLLAEGEKSVSQLEEQLHLRQPAVSQQLARLRADGLVAHRRDGKNIYYSLASDEARQMMALLYKLFCAPAKGEAKPRREK